MVPYEFGTQCCTLQQYSVVSFPNVLNIILILNNYSAHFEARALVEENVNLLSLPPNCTSLVKLMDESILHTLKCSHKNYFVFVKHH